MGFIRGPWGGDLARWRFSWGATERDNRSYFQSLETLECGKGEWWGNDDAIDDQ